MTWFRISNLEASLLRKLAHYTKRTHTTGWVCASTGSLSRTTLRYTCYFYLFEGMRFFVCVCPCAGWREARQGREWGGHLEFINSLLFFLKHANFGLFLSPHRASHHSHLPDTSQRHLHASQKPFSSEKRARPPRVGLADWPRNPSRDPFKTRIHD